MNTGPIGGPPISQIDPDKVIHLLTYVAWGSAAVSIFGVLAGVAMLGFGSRQAPRMIVGGIIGTIVAVVVATSVLPQLPGPST